MAAVDPAEQPVARKFFEKFGTVLPRTGKKPTLRTHEMISFYFSGLADEEELLAHIQKLQPPAA